MSLAHNIQAWVSRILATLASPLFRFLAVQPVYSSYPRPRGRYNP